MGLYCTLISLVRSFCSLFSIILVLSLSLLFVYLYFFYIISFKWMISNPWITVRSVGKKERQREGQRRGERVGEGERERSETPHLMQRSILPFGHKMAAFACINATRERARGHLATRQLHSSFTHLHDITRDVLPVSHVQTIRDMYQDTSSHTCNTRVQSG